MNSTGSAPRTTVSVVTGASKSGTGQVAVRSAATGADTAGDLVSRAARCCVPVAGSCDRDVGPAHEDG